MGIFNVALNNQNKVALSGTKVGVLPNYLCFTAEADTKISFRDNKSGWASNPNLYYSFDKNIWYEYTIGNYISLNAGDKCYWKGDNSTFTTPSLSNKYIYFTSTGRVAASGNIMTLLDSKGELLTITTEKCFMSMFNDCTTLTTPPELPATTLSQNCYSSMFDGCTSLKVLPSLPATTLPQYCYYMMFWGCTSIKLSETKISEYQNSFRIPTSGTGTAGYEALHYMFYNTGGTFTGSPELNTTYYTSNEII